MESPRNRADHREYTQPVESTDPMIRRRYLGWLCATVLALSLAAPATAAPSTVDPSRFGCPGVQLAPALHRDPDLNPDGTPVRITPDQRGKYVPVIMVHGWTGSSTQTDARTGDFSHKIDLSTNQFATVPATRSLIGQLQRIPGAAVFTFDYHEYSTRWVDDPHIGPALGDAIDCLFRATGEKVIIVAHSMGGLAARYALTHRGDAGTDRASEVSTVVTFGTPETGSVLAMLGVTGLNLGAVTSAQLGVLRLILAVCGHVSGTKLDTGTPCDLLPPPLRALDSPAGQALRYGSAQLAELAPFPKGVTVDALAGDTVFTVPAIGWFRLPWQVDTVPVGDLIVTTDSAIQGTTSATEAHCAYQLSPVRNTTDTIGLLLGLTAQGDVAQPITSVAGACYHVNLMRTIQLTNEATGIINDDITGRTATKVVTVVPVDRNGNPAPGYTVVNDGGPVDCGSPTSYQSPAAVTTGIVYCFPTAAAADICWPEPDDLTILCGGYPWDGQLHRNTATSPITPVTAATDPQPWALELADGTRCRLRNGGAWAGRSDGLVGAYSCDPTNEVVLTATDPNAETIDKATPQWTVQVGVLDDRQTGSPPPRAVAVRVAYFAGAP
jgi:pimeloyl-ACP methyl ester carboxylesterase